MSRRNQRKIKPQQSQKSLERALIAITSSKGGSGVAFNGTFRTAPIQTQFIREQLSAPMDASK